jgi:hypothetical protein
VEACHCVEDTARTKSFNLPNAPSRNHLGTYSASPRKSRFGAREPQERSRQIQLTNLPGCQRMFPQHNIRACRPLFVISRWQLCVCSVRTAEQKTALQPG